MSGACELCTPESDFFDMTPKEQAAVVDLLAKTRQLIHAKHAPDGYNIGVNVGKAAVNPACMSTFT